MALQLRQRFCLVALEVKIPRLTTAVREQRMKAGWVQQ